LAIVGIFVPLWPTTPFLLFAAWCFFRSSQKVYFWLRSQPYLGKALDDWELKGAVSNYAKAMAFITIIGSVAVMWYMVPLAWVKVTATAFLTLASLFILTRPKP